MTSEMGNVLYRSDIRRESDKRVYGNLLHRAWHSLALTFRYYCSVIMLAMLAGLLWHHATIISVYLENSNKEIINVTFNFKASCGENRTMKNQEIPAGKMSGYSQFLSHAAFVKWAGENEDIFSLEVKVTLHTQTAGQWTTER